MRESFWQRWLINTLGVLAAAHWVPGIQYDGFGGLLLASLLLGVLNALVRPVLIVFALPLVLFTLGLFLLIINALLLYWVGAMLPWFDVQSFGAAFWGSLVISLVSFLSNRFLFSRAPKNAPPPPKREPSQWKDTPKGPIIDV